MVSKKKPTKISQAKVARPSTKAKKPVMRSFALARPTEPFFTFRITHQTLYWTILSVLVLALGLWVITINDRVQHIYDQIDASNAAMVDLPRSVKKQ